MVAVKGHGKNKYRLAGEQLARVGQGEAQELFAGRIFIDCPQPCMCPSGVARMKGMVENPDHDGRHWHEGQWMPFLKQMREADARRGLKYTKERSEVERRR